MFSIAVVQTKVISCNSANKSFIWQEVHTKAIASLMQFCDFYSGNNIGKACNVNSLQSPGKVI